MIKDIISYKTENNQNITGKGEKMIDIKKAKQELKKYVSNYDLENDRIRAKVAHIERVAQISKEIAESLNLSKEDIQLAELIGLLHDIGRFEQVKRCNTFVDKNSINHGKLGVEILFQDGLIRKFIEDDKYDKIIETAILNHNRSPKDLEFTNKIEEIHSKIIRDADKTDIMYILTFGKKEVAWEKDDLSNEKISDEIYREFIEDKSINYKEIKTSADILVTHFAYIFDFNYKYGLQQIKEKGYVEQIYKRHEFKDKETMDRYNNIYKVTKQYLESIVDNGTNRNALIFDTSN